MPPRSLVAEGYCALDQALYDATTRSNGNGKEGTVEAGPLDNIVANAVSPDQRVSASMGGGTQVEVRFQPGAYDRYDDATLSHQLSWLYTRIFAENRRAYFAALSQEVGQTITGDEREYSPQMISYRRAEAELTADGESQDGSIHITTSALTQWRVRIRRRAAARLTEAEFGAALAAAIRATINRG